MRPVGPALAITGFLATASPAGAQETVEVLVDATTAGAPLEKVWPFFGYDEINYTTDPEGKALLGALAASQTAPVHIRSHFLLNTGDGVPSLKWGSTNVYTEDAAGNPVYDWTLTDGIMDGITAAGAFPFVELGFMPQALSPQPIPYRNSSSSLLDGGSYFPPTDHAKWADLIRTWAVHANGRYPEVAANWLWELWNEPDIGYWNGTVADYATLFDHTESALHQVLPNAALGGPAVAGPGGTFLIQFLKHCATGVNAVTGAVGTRLDHVTFHAKGGVDIVDGHVQMDLGNQMRLHRAGFRSVASFPEFKQTPIYITEADPDGCAACPISSAPPDAYRNSTAYGAYELSMMKHSVELGTQLGIKLGGLLTWAFTFPGTPYFAGYRTLATNGINLPVLGAFKLLGRLDGNRVSLTSSAARPLDDVLTDGVRDGAEVDGMATTDGAAIQVLLWTYHDDLVPVPATPIKLAIKVPAGFGPNARIHHLRVDESHGDAYTAWAAQGMPATPSAAQVAALETAMNPAVLVPDQTVAVTAEGTVAVAFDLPRFGISLVTITVADTAEGHTGSGCACHAGGREADAAGPLALLALGAWLLLATLRRPRALNGRGHRRNSAE